MTPRNVMPLKAILWASQSLLLVPNWKRCPSTVATSACVKSTAEKKWMVEKDESLNRSKFQTRTFWTGYEWRHFKAGWFKRWFRETRDNEVSSVALQSHCSAKDKGTRHTGPFKKLPAQTEKNSMKLSRLKGKRISSWWFQPIWKIFSSIWIISPMLGVEN